MALKRHPANLAAIILLGMTAMQPVLSAGEWLREDSAEAVAVIAEGSHSAIAEPRQAVLRDAGALRALWSTHAAYLIPPPAPPAVDFSTSTVVAVFVGNRSSGGHALAVSGLNRTTSGWHLSLSLLKPGAGCLVTQALTQPWVMVRVPGRDQSVGIAITESTRSCGD